VTSRAAILFFALLTLALLSTWLADLLAPVTPVVKPERHTPDFYLAGVTLKAMDEEGRLQHRMRAARIIHYGDDDSSELIQPYFYIIDSGRPRWEMHSETATASGDGKQVNLQGSVVITRLGQDGAELATRDLLLRPREDYVETAAQVTFKDGSSQLQAVGLRGSLGDGGTLELLANVRGKHAAKQK